VAKLERPELTAFKGLNNVSEPLSLDGAYLALADNCTIDDLGDLLRAEGYARMTHNTNIVGAYTTKDFERFYIIDAGELRQMTPNWTYRVLRTGLSPAPYYFHEINGNVYYSNGTDRGVCEPDGWRPWGMPTPNPPNLVVVSGNLDAGTYRVCVSLVDNRGMESANSLVAAATVPAGSGLQIVGIDQVPGYSTNVYATTADGRVLLLLTEHAGDSASYNDGPNNLGREFDTQLWFSDPPRGDQMTFFEGQLYCGEWFPEHDMSILWRSVPLHYHHFKDSLAVPGQLLLLRSSTETLFAGNERLTQRGVAENIIIGTERAIFSWSDNQLVTLANYGVIPGHHAAESRGKLYFWTERGLCRALPFENLTEGQLSVPPGVSAGGAVIERNGYRRYVVALHRGGEAYNARSSP
jgi:hypothetical protein